MRGFKPKQAKGKDGGPIIGPGTGTSDSIKTEMPEGSYVMPADSTEAIGHDNLAQLGSEPISQGRDVPVAVSNGEHELSPDQVHAIGVQALDGIKAATHTPLEAPGNQQEPRHFFADGGHVVRGLLGAKHQHLKRAGGGVVSEDERQRQNASVAGAPGVQRTGNSYSNTEAPRLPSWEARQSFPATHQRERRSPAPQPDSGLANQIPGPTQSQIATAANISSGRAPASSPAASKTQAPALSSPGGAAYGQGPVNTALFGAGSPTGMYVADQQAERQKMVAAKNYAGAAGNALKTGVVGTGMGILELADRTVGDAWRELSDPTGEVGRFAGGALGTDNSDGSMKQPAAAPVSRGFSPRDTIFDNDRIANNALGINGIPTSSLSGASVPGPARQTDMMARTAGTGRGFAPGAQAALSTPQEQATIPYMADGRRGKTNAEVGAENPAGRVQMVRQPNGTMSFSGTDVRGPVSYTNGQGQPLAGGGLRGRGFSSVDTVSSGAMGAAQGRQSNFQAINAARDAAAQRGDWDGVAQSYAAQGRSFNSQAPAEIQAGMNRRATIVDAQPLGFSTRAERSEQLRQQRMQDAMRDGNMANAQRSALAEVYRSDNNLREASMRGASDMARAQMEQQAATERQAGANAASLTEAAMREDGETMRALPAVDIARRTMRLTEAEAGDASTIRGFEIEGARQIQGLRDQYAAAKDATQRALIARQIQELSGKAGSQNENLSNSFMSVGGGQEWNEKAGVMRNVPQKLIDLRTGQEVGGSVQGPQPTDKHINGLRKDPSAEARAEFDMRYGPGSAARVLNV